MLPATVTIPVRAGFAAGGTLLPPLPSSVDSVGQPRRTIPNTSATAGIPQKLLFFAIVFSFTLATKFLSYALDFIKPSFAVSAATDGGIFQSISNFSRITFRY
jgi:hypothetical protein